MRGMSSAAGGDRIIPLDDVTDAGWLNRHDDLSYCHLGRMILRKKSRETINRRSILSSASMTLEGTLYYFINIDSEGL